MKSMENNVQKSRWLSFMGLYETSLIIRPGNMFAYPTPYRTKKRRITTYLIKKQVEEHNMKILKT